MDKKELIKQRAKISNAISSIEAQETRAANGNAVGCFYKYKNSCPEKPSDYWWMYSKVERMDKDGHLHGTSFQIDCNKDVRANAKQFFYHDPTSQGHVRITKREYEAAAKKVVTALTRLL